MAIFRVVRRIHRIVNLAAWAQRPEAQRAIPDIQATLSGASKTEQLVALHLTDRGMGIPMTDLAILLL
jgi:hypothetical protein